MTVGKQCAECGTLGATLSDGTNNNRTIPVSGNCPDHTHNEPLAPTPFDQNPSDSVGSVEDLPYSSYLDANQFAIPGVFDLVSLVAQARLEAKTSQSRRNHHTYVPGEHIVAAEVLAKEPNAVRWHDIDCASAHSLEQHSQILKGAGSRDEVEMRYLVMDDISARAVEILGHSFRIDPAMFVKHLHQIIEGCSVENVCEVTLPHFGYKRSVSPFPLRTVSAPFAMGDARCGAKKDQTHMVNCPTDMHVIPSDIMLRGAPIISSDFEERQLQRVAARNDVDLGETLVDELGRRSFMRPSICGDFGPYLPLWPMPGDNNWRFPPFQRITFDRSDHAIVHLPGDPVVPTVIILRTPSEWNKSIHASRLQPLHDELSDNKARWEVRASSDCFRFCIGPDVVQKSPASSTTTSPVGANSQPQHHLRSGPHLDHEESLKPNMALCKILVEWHMRCVGVNASLLQANIPALLYLLERSLSRLRALATEDYKRAYCQCSDRRLKIAEQRRLLDYCRTRAMRWEHLKLSNSRMVGEVHDLISQESGAAPEFLRTCANRLRSLIQQIEDQLRKSREFIHIQLEHIAADQQRELVHNQIELSQLQIAESRRAIQQTETVRRLTILAFVFIPTSTICSFFGMNVKELDNHPRLWVFFLSLIAVVSIVLVIATADGVLTFLMRTFAAMPALPIPGEPAISYVRRSLAVFLLKVVHSPFALLWSAASIISQKWSLFMSQGRAYRTGYYDSTGSVDRESRTQATDLTTYMQRGARLAFNQKDLFENYQRRWREFWTLPNRGTHNIALNIPSAPYYTSHQQSDTVT